MIGHFLGTLTAEQEDRVLATVMRPRSMRAPCLLGVAFMAQTTADLLGGQRLSWPRVGFQFDGLCRRFGVSRINAAIRNRILANQARRALAAVRETVSV